MEEKCWVIFIITFIAFLFVYSPYLFPAASYVLSNSNKNVITPTLPLQESLEKLVESPIVGHIFYE